MRISVSKVFRQPLHPAACADNCCSDPAEKINPQLFRTFYISPSSSDIAAVPGTFCLF